MLNMADVSQNRIAAFRRFWGNERKLADTIPGCVFTARNGQKPLRQILRILENNPLPLPQQQIYKRPKTV
jgi:hypothetical protein